MRKFLFLIVLIAVAGEVLAWEKREVAQILYTNYVNQLIFYPGIKKPYLILDLNGDNLDDVITFAKENSINFELPKNQQYIDLAEGEGDGKLDLVIIQAKNNIESQNKSSSFLIRNFDEVGIEEFTDDHARIVKSSSRKKLFKAKRCRGDILSVFTESSAPIYLCWNGKYEIFGDPDDLP